MSSDWPLWLQSPISPLHLTHSLSEQRAATNPVPGEQCVGTRTATPRYPWGYHRSVDLNFQPSIPGPNALPTELSLPHVFLVLNGCFTNTNDNILSARSGAFGISLAALWWMQFGCRAHLTRWKNTQLIWGSWAASASQQSQCRHSRYSSLILILPLGVRDS